MKKLFPIITYLILVLLISSCGKDKDVEPEKEEKKDRISGKVILPEGSTFDLNDLTVVTPYEEGSVVSEVFSVETNKEEFNTLFLMDDEDEVIMMGYNYPGQTDFNISTKSTVLAIVMNTPSALSLSRDAKMSTINLLLSNSTFDKAIVEIESAIKSNVGALDTLNTAVQEAIAAIYSGLRQQKPIFPFDEPIVITQANRQLGFSNKVAHNYAIGVYKNESITPIEEFTLGETNFVASDIKDLLEDAFVEGEKSKEVYYQLPEDGTYDIKIRSGWGSTDLSKEWRNARVDNIGSALTRMIFNYLPLDLIKSCGPVIIKEIAFAIKDFPYDADISTTGTASVYLARYFDNTISRVLNFDNACISGNESLKSYFKGFKKLVFWYDVATKIANVGNDLIFVSSWALSDKSIDLCYSVNGNVVGECCKDFGTFQDSRDNKFYMTMCIGGKTWFAENLRYDASTSRCYDNNIENCNTYGRLYNWSTAQIACPTGWHLPEISEWDEMINALGGYDRAGGKLKEKGTDHWDAPNTGATDEIGFSALGAGQYRIPFNSPNPVFEAKGSSGSWWSSTQLDSDRAFNVQVVSNDSIANRYNFLKKFGLSCRCVKD